MSAPPMRFALSRLGAASLMAVALAAPAAPDEASYGAAEGYPHGSPSTWAQQRHLVGALSAMDSLYPSRRVAAGAEPRPLPPHPAPPDWPFVQAYLDRHPATGLLVVQDGRILVERYQYGRQAGQRFMSFSMVKTVVAMAVGIALEEGRIESIDDPVDRYEPALAASAWKGVSLRDVLQMSSGVKFDETYEQPDSDISRFSRAWSRQSGALLQGLQQFKEREAEPGTRFHYVSADTQVLAQVLTRATGQPLSEYVGTRLWSPMGAEADATWLLDGAGHEAGHCCLNARLRDWGRLGLLLLDGGQREGRSIIPKAWVEAATHVRAQDRHLQPRRATAYHGYGYQTWIFPDDFGFALLGVRGQAVFVHPPSRLVMVQTAVWPRSRDADLARDRDRFWRAVVQAAQRR